MANREILEKKQVAKLLMIISEPNINMNDTFKTFTKEYKSIVLRACASLSLLLDINLLNQKQRLLGLFILIKSYEDKLNPFFDVIDKILNESKENYEKKMISELVLGLNKQEWEGKTANDITKDMKNFTEEYEVPDEINNIRVLFKENISEVVQKGSIPNQIPRIIPDFDLNNEETMIPTDTLKLQSIDNEDLHIQNYELDLLTLMPNEIPLRDDEIKWVVPFIQDDVMWMQGEDQNVVDMGLKGLIKLASEETLTSTQMKYILDLSARNLDSLCGENSQSGDDFYFLGCINGIVDKNTNLMIAIMIMLSNSKPDFFKKVLTKYLAVVDQTIHSLEVVYNLLQQVEIPQNFFNAYIFDWFKCCEDLSKDIKKQNRNLKLVTKFVTHLLKKEYFDPSQCYDVWIKFCAKFADHKCAKALGNLLETACSNKEKN